jgi:hypothetical protein
MMDYNERYKFVLFALILAVSSLVGIWLELKKGKDRIIGRRTNAGIGGLISLQWCYIGVYIAFMTKYQYEHFDVVDAVSNLIFPIAFVLPMFIEVIELLIYSLFIKGKKM